MKKIRHRSVSTWAQAVGLWVISTLVGSGIYLTDMAGLHTAALFRSSEGQLMVGLLVVLAGVGSLPTSLLAKFAYAYTLRRPRRRHRVLATLAALLSLYCLGAGLSYSVSAGSQVLNPLLLRTAPGVLLSLAPYLLGGLLGTLLVYRRTLFAPSQII